MDNEAVQLHTPILEFFLGCSKFHEVKLEYTARSKLTQLFLANNTWYSKRSRKPVYQLQKWI